jgi:LmbE family N-acetylglucosaminyl deacetylase
MATIVAFHAHPDDEVLLTGGTIARLAAEGHRVIIVVACDGDMWANPDRGPGRRLDELRASAEPGGWSGELVAGDQTAGLRHSPTKDRN